MKKRRVFVAIGISSQLKEEIAYWQKKWNHLSVRWIKPENMHVTLVPPWYVSEVDEVIEDLKSVNQNRKRFWTSQNYAIKPFTITFREVTFGPSPKRPRLVWASADATAEIKTLKSKLEGVLGLKTEKRPFSTHLTIARFKEKDFSKFPIKGLNEEIFWEERVNSFLVMESRLKRSGAEYEKLAEIPLTS